MGSKVLIKIGSYGQPRGTKQGPDIQNDIREFIDKRVSEEVIKTLHLDVPRLSQALTKNLRAVYNEANQDVVRRLVGSITSANSYYGGSEGKIRHRPDYEGQTSFSISSLTSASFGARLNYRMNTRIIERGKTPAPGRDVRVTWQNLKRETIKKKRKSSYAEAAKFFVNKGNLKLALTRQSFLHGGQLFRISRRFLKGTESLLGKEDKVHINLLRIQLLPGVRASMLPGLYGTNINAVNDEMSFERDYLGIQGKDLAKLMNGNRAGRPKRHLMQPIYTFYTRFEAPRAIAAALGDARILQ